MKIADILLMLLMAGFAYRGAARGLWLTAARLFGALAAVGITWWLHPAVKAWIIGKPALTSEIQGRLISPFLAQIPPEGPKAAITQLAEAAARSELPGLVKRLLLTSSPVPGGAVVTLNETVISFASFILLLAVTLLIIQGVLLALDRLFRLPGLGFLNRTAGFVLGAAEGAVLLWAALAVMTPLISFRPEGVVAGAIRSGDLVSWMYEHNFLLMLIDFNFK